jgi:hypothetical protein
VFHHHKGTEAESADGMGNTSVMSHVKDEGKQFRSSIGNALDQQHSHEDNSVQLMA